MSNLMNTLQACLPSSMFRVSGLAAVFAFLIFLCAAPSASAADFTVTTTADNGVGSLREAIASVNASAANDAINFAIPANDAGCTAGVCTITLTGGEFSITSAATAGTLTITNLTGASNLLISGNDASRVIYLNSGANLTMSGVTITKGNGVGANTGGGGGVYNSGMLALTNSTVSGNTANGSFGGGGILNFFGSTTALTNSTVSGNTANGSFGGGGISNINGTAILTGSTVSGNTTNSSGGGIYSTNSTTTLTNSTVSGNTAGNGGGGIYISSGTLNLTSVTVTRNNVPDITCTRCMGGIFSGGTANLKNTIVAGNTTDYSLASPDFDGVIAAGSSYNLIGDGYRTTGISNGDANNNQVGTAASPIDPKLDPVLKPNGGATMNHALLTGSPAIDKGNMFGTTTDQRGLMRPFDDPSITNAGDGADIGTFEVQLAPSAASVSISGRVLTANGRGIRNVRLTLTDSYGQSKTAATTAFGYYRFNDVQAGETYILSAVGRSFSFSQPAQVLNINGDLDEVNFFANTEKSTKVFSIFRQ